jgi:hypothetical protein
MTGTNCDLFTHNQSRSLFEPPCNNKQLPLLLSLVKTICTEGVCIGTHYGLERPGIEPLPIAVAERSKATVCGCLLAGTADSITGGGIHVCVLYSTVKTKTQARTIKKKRSQEKSTKYRWDEIFRTACEPHTASCTMGTTSIPGVGSTTHPHLAPRLR